MVSMATKSIFDLDSPIKNPPKRQLISYDDDDLFAFGNELPNDQIDCPKNVSITVTVKNPIGNRYGKRKQINIQNPTNGANKKQIIEVPNKTNHNHQQQKYYKNPSSGEYEIVKQIGSGTYGQVYKARLTSTNFIIAVKRMHIKLNTPNLNTNLAFTKREYENLTELNDCEYIVRLLKGREEQLSKNDLQVDYLFEYCPHVMRKVIENKRIHFQLAEIKAFLRQMLLGLNHMHDKLIMHRDFKTENILLTLDGVVKIADFGLSRKISDPTAILGKEQYTPTVVTQWYRAPEILFLQSYNEQCDMWSFGCVMGEFWNRSAILPGENEIDQIKMISRLCGSDNLPKCTTIKLPRECRKTRFYLKDKIPKVLDDQANNLFDQLMNCNPQNRLTALKALNHHFFFTDPLPSMSMKDFMKRVIPNLCT